MFVCEEPEPKISSSKKYEVDMESGGGKGAEKYEGTQIKDRLISTLSNTNKQFPE